MSDSPLHSSWNATDSSEERVPVREAGPARRPAAATVRIEAVNQKQMHLAAFTGIGIVLLLGSLFYFGTDSLRGSLTDGGGRQVSVSITKTNTFDPADVTVHPGDQLVITNENPDPQVLKSKGNEDLFVTQVLFDEPFSFVVPDTALGKTYQYVSETLPEDQVLVIRVTAAGTDAVSSSSSDPGDIIPLPPVTATSSSEESSSESASSSSSSASIPTVQAVSSSSGGQPTVVAFISSSIKSTTSTQPRTSGNTETFSLHPAGGTPSSSSSLPSLTGNNDRLASNPYTVGNREEAERLGLIPSSKSSSSSSLHSGANLRRVTPTASVTPKVTKPRTNVASGAGDIDMILVTLVAGCLMTVYFRRVTRVAA